MGNSASQLPFSIDNQVGAPHDHNGWAFHTGKSTDGNETIVSVFVGKKPQLAKQPVSPRFPNQTQLVPALHHYNHCRKLRHPHILKVYATLDTDNPKAAATEGGPPAPSAESNAKATTGDLIVVTEPCIPLSQWLLSNPTPEQLAWGLECLVRGLHFMHGSAKLAHGNLSAASFYVTKSGDVKLWNFSLVTQIGPNLGPTNHFKEWEHACTPDTYRSTERVERRWDAISSAGVHCMDSYGLGILIDHWYQGRMPPPLQKAVQRLQTSNIKMRPRLQPLLKCPIFDTPYQKLQLQLEEITIQPVEQKVALWQNLGTFMQSGNIPQDVAVHKVLPLIQNSIKTICNNENMLNQDLYRREVLSMMQPLFFILETHLDASRIGNELGPLVALLFKVKDRGVRGALLSKVTFMSQHLPKNTLNASVFEPLCSGFNDSSPALRELTLKATLGLVPFLSSPNIEKLSRYLVRLQADTETSIRTNSVIFISKLAPNLSEISREKMLLPAYARAMKDPFAPCRLSAVQSTLKSKDLFSVTVLAAKVLPAVMPLCLDQMANVRKEAFKVVNDFLKDLKRESDRLETLAQQQAAQHQVQQPTMPAATPAAADGVTPAPASGSYLSGLSSWMSSSTNPENVGLSPAGPTAPMTPAPRAPPPVSTSVPPVQQMAATSLAPPPPESDGWDDTDGWGDDDNDNDNDLAFSNIGAKMPSTPMTSSNFSSPSNNFSPPSQYSTPFQFSAEQDDPFAAIGVKTAAAPRPTARGNSGGKLILPKKTAGMTLKPKVAAPATKLQMDDSEMADGWDDF